MDCAVPEKIKPGTHQHAAADDDKARPKTIVDGAAENHRNRRQAVRNRKSDGKIPRRDCDAGERGKLFRQGGRKD